MFNYRLLDGPELTPQQVVEIFDKEGVSLARLVEGVNRVGLHVIVATLNFYYIKRLDTNLYLGVNDRWGEKANARQFSLQEAQAKQAQFVDTHVTFEEAQTAVSAVSNQ